jgi:hypothetical protein
MCREPPVACTALQAERGRRPFARRQLRECTPPVAGPAGQNPCKAHVLKTLGLLDSADAWAGKPRVCAEKANREDRWPELTAAGRTTKETDMRPRALLWPQDPPVEAPFYNEKFHS